MKLPNRTNAAPEEVNRLLRDSRVSWAGLSSPLRTLPCQTTLTFRHTPLADMWRMDDRHD
ncbi:hypothetical protein [Brevibacillus dissolubilis]|uniref:hypothetical protein n=1 Tax=Brevibacillus dissolubilis TaxID=1844116 RepID=UPI001115DD39|nr:hypothetical protein [Brevibacillus dissolubilis]